MSNDYFNHSANVVVQGSLARASQVNDIATEIEVGLDKLPTENELKHLNTNYVADTGAADAYVVALTYTITSYPAGLSLTFKATYANTGASTLAVDGLAAKAIKRTDGTALQAADITADSLVTVIYDETNFQIISAVQGMITEAETAQTASETAQTASETAQTAAETAQTNAETAETAAETAQTNAETAETNAETAETNAALEKTYAEEWAQKAEDSLVSVAAGGDGSTEYSAKHWAAKAYDNAGLPDMAGNAGEFLTVNSGETGAEWSELPAKTLATESHTFAVAEVKTITLSEERTKACVAVTKEYTQIGQTNNIWTSSIADYETEDFSVNETLTLSATTGEVTATLASSSFTDADIGRIITYYLGGVGNIVSQSAGVATVAVLVTFSTTNLISSGWGLVNIYPETLRIGSDTADKKADAFNFGDDDEDLSSKSGLVQMGNGYDFCFNNDGTKIYIPKLSDKTIHEYPLSTAYMVSTIGTETGSVATGLGNISGICMKPDGTKIFVGDVGAEEIWEFDLSTAYLISSATVGSELTNVTYDATYCNTPYSLYMDSTGKFLYNNDGSRILKLTLNTAWDASASYTGGGASGNDGNFFGISFASDGLSYVTGSLNDGTIKKWELDTAWVLKSTSTLLDTYDISAGSTCKGGFFDDSNSKFFYVDDDVLYTAIFKDNIVKDNEYSPAISPAINTTYWTDLNNITTDTTDNSQDIFCLISVDERTTWLAIHDTNGTREVVKEIAGVWNYNSNVTFDNTTWTAASVDTEIQAMKDAMTVAANKATDVELNDTADADYPELDIAINLAVILFTDDDSVSPLVSSTAINYNANILKQGAILGTDYDYDQPENDVIRVTALTSGNYDIRII